jgi:glycine betaine/proline transport system substrate-binding protein
MIKKINVAFLMLLAVVGLLAAACGGGDGSEKTTIIFSDLNWDSAQQQNAIARRIVEDGFGYPTDVVAGDTISLFQGLQNGDTHVTLEIWLPNQIEAWNKAMTAGSVVPLGKSLADNWQSMFLIPRHTADANPGLKSVSDIAAHKDLFVTADSKGKAALITCIPGWECEKSNAVKWEGYGLQDVVELINPGSGAALEASIRGAFTKQDNWLGYYWGPTTVSAELDLVVLEEPAYSDACWATDKACAYPTAEILVAVHPSLIGGAPDVIEFLRNWDFPAEHVVAVATWQNENDATMEEVAEFYLNNYESTWKAMVPADIAEKVSEGL